MAISPKKKMNGKTTHKKRSSLFFLSLSVLVIWEMLICQISSNYILQTCVFFVHQLFIKKTMGEIKERMQFGKKGEKSYLYTILYPENNEQLKMFTSLSPEYMNMLFCLEKFTYVNSLFVSSNLLLNPSSVFFSLIIVFLISVTAVWYILVFSISSLKFSLPILLNSLSIFMTITLKP